VLFTCKITPEVLANFRRNYTEEVHYVASGLSSFNGQWLREEVKKNNTDAQFFLDHVKPFEVKAYGIFGDLLTEAVLRAIDSPVQKAYSDFPYSKTDKIQALLAKGQDLKHPGWTTFEKNVREHLRVLELVHRTATGDEKSGTPPDEKQAKRVWDDHMKALRIFSDADLDLDGETAPFLVKMAEGDEGFVRHITTTEPAFAKPGESVHHSWRHLTKIPITFEGSKADIGAIFWLLLRDHADPATFSTVPLSTLKNQVEAQVNAMLECGGGLQRLAEAVPLGNIPTEWHEDGEADDARAWALVEALVALKNGASLPRRVTYRHPSLLSAGAYAGVPKCVSEIVPCKGVNKKAQVVADREFRECAGCAFAQKQQ
jgi:hypothetical protein